MKTTSNQLMAMLVLGFLAAATKALNCSPPPVPATRAWVDNITSGIPRCTVVNGDLHLGRNCTDKNTCSGPQPTLTDAVDLGAVETITGRLTCWGNPSIKIVTADSLTNTGAVQMDRTYLNGVSTKNTLLTGFSFPALVNVSGEVDILNNDNWPGPSAFTTIGLGALQTIGGFLDIRFNRALTYVDLGALQTVGGYLYIRRNPALTSMGLGALETVEGYLDIGNNYALTSVDLGALQKVWGYLDIGDNYALTSMGLGALETVEGYLYIGGNDDLPTMGLGALQTVGGDLLIEGNDVLASMGLGALQTVVGDLNIKDNNNPLDIEVNEKSPLLVCADPLECPGTVLTIAPPTMQPTALPTMHPTGAEKYNKLENTRIGGKRLMPDPQMNSTDLGKCMNWCDNENKCKGFHVRDGQCIMKKKNLLRSNMTGSTAFVKQDVSGEMEVLSEDPDDPDASSDSDDVDVVNTAPRATGPTGAGAALLFLLPLLY